MTEQFVSGRDVFVSLPTGSGKSVCYGCLPLVFDKLRDDGDHHSIVVVVAPLSALMTDHVSSFNARGLKASCVGVNICSKDQPTCEDAIVRGDFQLLFINPETRLIPPGGTCLGPPFIKKTSLLLLSTRLIWLRNGQFIDSYISLVKLLKLFTMYSKLPYYRVYITTENVVLSYLELLCYQYKRYPNGSKRAFCTAVLYVSSIKVCAIKVCCTVI